MKKRKKLKWKLLRLLSYTNKLTSYQKFASRVGYMGSGFLIAAQWTIEPALYIVGFIFVIVQTSSRKQWNLVALNVNGLIAWITHLIYQKNLFILRTFLVSLNKSERIIRLTSLYRGIKPAFPRASNNILPVSSSIAFCLVSSLYFSLFIFW